MNEQNNIDSSTNNNYQMTKKYLKYFGMNHLALKGREMEDGSRQRQNSTHIVIVTGAKSDPNSPVVAPELSMKKMDSNSIATTQSSNDDNDNDNDNNSNYGYHQAYLEPGQPQAHVNYIQEQVHQLQNYDVAGSQLQAGIMSQAAGLATNLVVAPSGSNSMHLESGNVAMMTDYN